MDVDAEQALRPHDPGDGIVGTGASPRSGTVPFALRVGITGHRHLPPGRIDALHNEVGIALDRVRDLFPPTPETGVVFTAVSALAEGADRLVVDAVLEAAGSRLEVVLPLREKAYLVDFKTESSKQRFLELCDKASMMVTAPEIRREDEEDLDKRSRQYEWASRYVVERCDVLLALWDGKASRGTGGTAETLRYALEHRVPVLCIPTEGGELLEDLGSGEIDPGFSPSGIGDRHPATSHDTTPIDQTRRSFAGLDSYNRVPRLIFAGNNPLAPGRFDQEVATETMYLPADPPGIDLDELADWVRPYYVWADRRAVMFERWYTIGIWVSFCAAALAVSAAALGGIFEIKEFFGVELVLLLCIGAVVFFGRRFHLHDQWINSRFLAERLRSAVFLNAAGLGDRRDSGLTGLGPQNEYADWLRRAYEFVWDSRPDSDDPRLADLCELLAEGWIQPQIDYHRRKCNAHEGRESLLLNLSLVLFGLTFVLAVIHIIGPPMRALSVLAIGLPAFGSSIAGVSAHLQYHRHAVVYAGMARHLEFVKQRIKNAYTPTTLRAAASDADLIMASEQRDWIGVMRFLDLEVG